MIRDGGRFALGAVSATCVIALCYVLAQLVFTGGQFDRAIVGAIIGGFLAGIASLAATIVANLLAARRGASDRLAELEARAYALLAKMHAIRDATTKGYRHYLDSTPEHSLSLSPLKRIPKPLYNSEIGLSFTDLDRALALELKEAGLFNRVLDAEAIARAFDFHERLYEEKFASLYDDIFEKSNLEIDGFTVKGDAVVNKRLLMEAEDARNLLLSFLFKAPAEIVETHRLLIECIERHFGRRLSYKETDVPAQAPNYFSKR